MNYDYLKKEPGPKMLLEALALLGTKEVEGEGNNPAILKWAEKLGLKDYKADSIPWCGLFMAYVASMAGKPVPAKPLWARNWVRFGEHCEPELGAVLVFSRADFGHVGLYVGEDASCFHVLGGNQSDAVGFARIAKDRLLDSRAMYSIQKPENVRKIILSSSGAVSTNEA